MRTKIKFFTGLVVIFSIVASCSGEDGMDGAQGPAGVDGLDGQNGTDGEDGNANVQVLTYDISDATGRISYTQDVPEITEEVFTNDVILGYISRIVSDGSERLYPIPTTAIGFSDYGVSVSIRIGAYTYSLPTDDGLGFFIGDPEFYQLKVVIIQASNTTSGKSLKGDVLTQLKDAGVDTTNFYAVMDYYGLQ